MDNKAKDQLAKEHAIAHAQEISKRHKETTVRKSDQCCACFCNIQVIATRNSILKVERIKKMEK